MKGVRIRKIKKGIRSVFLSLCLVLGMLPQTVWAEESPTDLTQTVLDTYKDAESKNYVLPAGSYRLTENIRLSAGGYLSVQGETVLDLNGCVLQQTKESGVIFLSGTGCKLTIRDSNPESEHKFDTSALPWTWQENGSGETVRGGVITGGKKIEDKSTFYLGCAGGVYCGAGELIMEGGSIVGCGDSTNLVRGGGVYVSAGGTFTMQRKAAILGCYSTDYGNAVYCTGKAVFTMEDESCIDKNDNTAPDIVLDSSACMKACEGKVTGRVSVGRGASLADVSGGDVTKFTGAVTNEGTIGGGSFAGAVTNQSGGTITGGSFEGAVTNQGKIEGGSFEGAVTNRSGGTITNGSFAGAVTNQSGGTITGGSFAKAVENKYGAAIDGGSFQSTVTNDNGQITGGTFQSTVTNQSGGTITGGSFAGAVTNQSGGTIKGGSFAGAVTNSAMIMGGTFSGSVTNQSGGSISGGTFSGTLTNNGSIVDGTLTVAFNLNDGSGKTWQTQYCESGACVTKPTDPTRTGYVFGEWYGEAAGETAWQFTDTVTEDLILYAKWVAKTGYSVSFASGVSEGETAAVGNMPENKSGTLSWTDEVLSGSEAPTRTGYAFTGWKCEGKDVTDETTYADLAGTDESTGKTFTLTAQWKQSKQPTGTITFKQGENEFGTWSAFTAENAGNPSVWVKPETYTVEITGSADAGEKVEIAYLILTDSAESITETALAGRPESDWTAYTEEVPCDISDGRKYILCARLKGSTGLVTYLCSDGIVADGTVPVITGVEDGKTYCGSTTVTVTDVNRESVKADGNPVTLSADGSFTLFPKTGAQTIVATDKAGNETRVTVTVNNGHTYEWKSESGKYWQKCKYCGDETAKSEIPQLTITGAPKVCRTQNAVLTFTLPTDVTLSTCRYGFGALAMQTITPVKDAEGRYTLTVSAGDCPEGEHELRVSLETAMQDGFPLTAETSVAIQDAHSGGTATCTERAVCEVCGDSYGEVNTSNHTGEEKWEKTADTHKKYWSCCNEVVVETEAHEWSDGICAECGYVCQHSGGTATCTESAVCEVCGDSYGEVNTSNHTGEEKWEKTADTHKKYWSCCNEVVVETEAHEWSDGICAECGYVCQHSGGTATCKERAVCEVCGASYGGVDVFNHANGLTYHEAVSATVSAPGSKEYRYCADCGKYFADADGRTQITQESTVLPRLQPTILDGDGQSVTAGAGGTLTFRSSAPFAELLRVELDGRVLERTTEYDAAEGSTIITLHSEVVALLQEGEHSLSIVSVGGTATASFTVAARAATPTPEPTVTPPSTPDIVTITPPVAEIPGTGDDGIFVGLLILLFVSGSVCIGLWLWRRKQGNAEE